LCTMPLPAMHCPQATRGRTPAGVVQTANAQQCHTQLGACFETTVSRLEPKLVPPGRGRMVIVERCMLRTEHPDHIADQARVAPCKRESNLDNAKVFPVS